MVSISLILPVRGTSYFYSKSILNNLKQLELNDELIVVDDNKDDIYSKELLEIRKKFYNVTNLKIVKNPGNGLVPALNYGISISKNNWIARVDVDDLYSENRLKVQKRFIRKGVSAIFTDYQFIDSEGNNLGAIYSPIFNDAILISLISSQRTPHPSVIFSKQAFLKSGGYKEIDFPVEDLSLWLRLNRYGKLISIPDILLYYRIHDSSITAKNQIIIKNKRDSLLKNYRFPKHIFQIRKYLLIFKKYKNYSFKAERRLLFTYDFIKLLYLKKYYFKIILITSFILITIVIKPGYALVLSRMFRERIKRNHYRDLFHV